MQGVSGALSATVVSRSSELTKLCFIDMERRVDNYLHKNVIS